VTTLGRALADALALPHHDTDDYLWAPTTPPYRELRKAEDRLRLMHEVFLPRADWVLSGGVDGWGNPLVPLFDLVIFLQVPGEVRIARLRDREARHFGADAVASGGTPRPRISSPGRTTRTARARAAAWRGRRNGSRRCRVGSCDSTARGRRPTSSARSRQRWRRNELGKAQRVRLSRTTTSTRAISKPAGAAGILPTIASAPGMSTSALSPSMKK
jgi:adenylate kinase family enzyme